MTPEPEPTAPTDSFKRFLREVSAAPFVRFSPLADHLQLQAEIEAAYATPIEALDERLARLGAGCIRSVTIHGKRRVCRCPYQDLHEEILGADWRRHSQHDLYFHASTMLRKLLRNEHPTYGRDYAIPASATASPPTRRCGRSPSWARSCRSAPAAGTGSTSLISRAG